MSEQVITVERREVTGRNIARKLARQGQVAAVVYGAGKDSVPIQVERRKVLELIKQAGSENAIFQLQLVGSKEQRHAMIREMQVDPVSRQILHIDFRRVSMDETIRVQVPVELIGEPVGVHDEGGVLDFVTREIELECLPGDIPDSVEVDVSHLHVGQHVEVSDLGLPDTVTLLEEPDRTVASVVIPRRVVEEEEVEEEELLLEAEAEEPEVIGRGKAEEEEAPEEESEEA